MIAKKIWVWIILNQQWAKFSNFPSIISLSCFRFIIITYPLNNVWRTSTTWEITSLNHLGFFSLHFRNLFATKGRWKNWKMKKLSLWTIRWKKWENRSFAEATSANFVIFMFFYFEKVIKNLSNKKYLLNIFWEYLHFWGLYIYQ